MDIENVKKAFGKNLESLRKRNGITQEELSLISGLHRTYVSEVERGKRNISLVNQFKLAKALNISLKELHDGVENFYRNEE